MLQNPNTASLSGYGPAYNTIVGPDATAGFKFVDDSATDYNVTDALLGSGKMKFNVISDCAAPVDVTIQFDATFTKCTSDYCASDSYHITPSWD